MTQSIMDISGSIDKTGSEEICKKLFSLLAETLPEDQNKLIQAIESNQVDMARSIIHKMHGGLTYCQSPSYCEQLLEIRELLCQNNIKKAIELLPNLKQLSSKLYEAIREYCSDE